MNASISTLVLLLLHLLVCLVLWLLIRCGILDIKGYFFPVILLVPIWGPLCVLILHTNRALFGDDLLEKTLKKMHINEESTEAFLFPETQTRTGHSAGRSSSGKQLPSKAAADPLSSDRSSYQLLSPFAAGPAE